MTEENTSDASQKFNDAAQQRMSDELAKDAADIGRRIDDVLNSKMDLQGLLVFSGQWDISMGGAFHSAVVPEKFSKLPGYLKLHEECAKRNVCLKVRREALGGGWDNRQRYRTEITVILNKPYKKSTDANIHLGATKVNAVKRALHQGLRGAKNVVTIGGYLNLSTW